MGARAGIAKLSYAVVPWSSGVSLICLDRPDVDEPGLGPEGACHGEEVPTALFSHKPAYHHYDRLREEEATMHGVERWQAGQASCREAQQ